MRGKEEDNLKFAPFVLITPAHAGKRVFGDDVESAREDHPRTCGEKIRLQEK